jgi:Big-like domain-containing protein/glucodextranase-like protein
MRRRTSAWLRAAISALAIWTALLATPPVRAEPAGLPDDASGVHSNGAQAPRGFAVQDTRRRVWLRDGGMWLASDRRVLRVSAAGTIDIDIDLVRSGYGRGTTLAVDAYDDSVWIGTDAALLLHVLHDGVVAHGASLPAPAQAIAIGLDQRPRVLLNDGIVEFSPDARWLGFTVLRDGQDMVSIGLAVDSLRDQVWIASERRLTAFDRTGTVAVDLDLSFLTDEYLAVAHYDHERETIVLRAEDGLLHVSRDGRIVAMSDLAEHAVVAMPSPVRIEPMLELIRPPSGGATRDPRLQLTFRLGATCNGTRCELGSYADTLQFAAQVNGTPTSDATAGPVRETIVVAPAIPMHQGSNELIAQVVDRFGHSAKLRTELTLLEDGASTVPVPEPQAVESAARIHRTTSDVPSPPFKAANKPPAVSLTAPAAGATFPLNATITLAAAASDSDGTIAKVEFYRGGSTLIGTATTVPYQIAWPNAAAGSYTLTAKAYDNKGAATTSAPVAISVVANQLPNVALTSPLAKSFYTAGMPIPLAATATDADGVVVRVEFLDGVTPVGSATAAPFAMSWIGSTAGWHSIAARATDDKGGVTVSSPVDIVIGQAPVVVVKSPVACTTVDGPADLILAADAISSNGPITRVDFYDGQTIVGTSYGPAWLATLAGAQIGTHMITARAVDARGVATTSRPSLVTVRAANQPPLVTLTAPSEGSRYAAGSTVALAANASDADGMVTAVEYRLGTSNGTLLGRATNAPYAATWTNVSAGTYTIIAIATDDRNATSTSAPVHVTVSANALPVVALTAPAAGASFTAPASISLLAGASDTDGSVVRVEFYAGGMLVGTSSQAPYGATWSGVTAGTYALTARAIDDLGGVKASAPVTITVTDNFAPTVTLTSPAAGTQYAAPATIVMSAIAADGDGSIARVEFYADSTLIGSSSAAAYTATWSGVAAGLHSLTARAFDNLGASALSVAIPVTVVANAAPAVTLTTPVAGARYFAPATIALSAMAVDSDGTIARVDFYAGSTLVGSATTAPYTASWSNITAGTYALSAAAVDNAGLSTTSTAITIDVVDGATIQPSAGIDGSAIDDDNVTVTGTIDAPANSGVLINGMVAQVVQDGRFYANVVPLVPGANVLTITAITQDGQMSSKTITVSSSGPAPFAVVATPTDGIAPLRVTFEITNRSERDFQRVELDFDGNGSADHTAYPADFVDGTFTLLVTYPAGTSASRITFYDTTGAVIQSVARIVTARTVEQQDALLRGVYDGMLGRLRTGNIAAALSAITGDLQDKYDAVFVALGANLPAAVDGLGTLEANWYGEDHAEYVVIRDTPEGQQAFLIDFIRGHDGIWRIHGM